MSEERIITAEGTTGAIRDAVLTAEGNSVNAPTETPGTTTTLQQRITASTKAGGLKSLPGDFDAQNGDWKCITATEPFAVLYLDYRQAMFITPDMVASNFALLDKFWSTKKAFLNTGSNRTGFKRKYSHPEGADNGDRIIDNSTIIIKTAYDKLSAKEGIERYFDEINNVRIRNGAEKLADSIQQMTARGIASKTNIETCIAQGLKYELLENETATLIKKKFDELGFLPYDNTAGNNLLEQLLSVKSWMTKKELDEAKRIEDELKKTAIQILKGRFASNIEEIGTILFEAPAEAKELIRNDILKNAVGQKDLVMASDVAAITRSEKDINLAFYKIVYKLNPSLPYPFAGKKFSDIPSLCVEISGNSRNRQQGKEDLQKGYIEAWIKETNPNAYLLFTKIRDTAENIDLALLSFLYTFNPGLPYRLGGSYLINHPKYLAETIDSSAAYWEEGKTELFDGSISTWLRVALQSDIPQQWDSVKNHFAQHPDVGLEYFLRQINPELPHPQIEASLTAIEYPAIQSGDVVTTTIVFTNTTRGCIEVYPEFTKDIPGVSLSSTAFLINNVTGNKQCTLQVTIDSTNLLKGVTYETAIGVKTTEKQELMIPVSFKIVFPKNAFIKQIALYAGIGALFFALIRLALASQYPDWLSHSFDFFINWNTAVNYGWRLALFGWLLLLFAAGLYFGMYFLIKYLRRK